MAENFRITAKVAEVLGVFLEDPTMERYGFELTKATNQPSGTLYPILLRLERAGWLETHWEEVGEKADRPPRRYYRMTAEGVEAARSHLAVLRERLDQVLGERPAW